MQHTDTEPRCPGVELSNPLMHDGGRGHNQGGTEPNISEQKKTGTFNISYTSVYVSYLVMCRLNTIR